MGDRLEQAGYPGMSSAVRPMAITPDERFIYLQVSFFHGVVEYDVVSDRVTRIGNLPNLVPNMPREQYLLDSAHHGIAINDDATKLCVAGTMSDYAAIVDRANFARHTLLQKGVKPYWSTTDDTGDYCFVSWSGSDAISAFSYRTEQEVARIQVGKHPQRVRTGEVRKDWIASLGGSKPSGGGASRTRTGDLRVANATLSQLSYGPRGTSVGPLCGPPKARCERLAAPARKCLRREMATKAEDSRADRRGRHRPRA